MTIKSTSTDIVRTATLTKLYKCDECENISDECGGKLYECGECGNKQVDERRCESCNKFMAKLAERSCVECEEGEVTPVYGVQCVCHEEFHEEAFDALREDGGWDHYDRPDPPSLAARYYAWCHSCGSPVCMCGHSRLTHRDARGECDLEEEDSVLPCICRMYWPSETQQRLPKIYCFIAGRFGDDRLLVMAVAEDRTLLASHVSSSESFAKLDIGFTSKSKHDLYRQYYPRGYTLVWEEAPPQAILRGSH